MKNLSKILFLCGIIVFMAFSCEKDDEYIKGVGIILDAGDPAVDGCGWLIGISDQIYKPIELDEQFQTDSLEVNLEYKILGSEWNCGWRLEKYKEINIKDIEKNSNN